MTTTTLDLLTPAGQARLRLDAPTKPSALLLLGHGAGGQIDSFDLTALAEGLPERGIAVARFEQPWVVAGKKAGPRQPVLDEAWQVALKAAPFRGVPFVVGGRSNGSRVACRCWDATQAGLVALSFPLHPPGKPESSRAAEMAPVECPVLIVQGEKDPFGTPDELRAELGAHANRMLVIDGADHSFSPKRKSDNAEQRAALIVDTVAGFVEDVTRG